MPILDLSDAQEFGETQWVPLPEGTYTAVIDEVTMTETKGTNPDAKLPAGTPVINVRFKVNEDEIPGDDMLPEPDSEDVTPRFSRTVYKGYVIAPKKYANKQALDNILYGFLKSIGYDAEEVKSGKFSLDPEDMAGRSCKLNLTVQNFQGKMQNNVRFVSEADSSSSLVV